MRTSSGPELMSYISTPSSNLHPIFIILPHPNNNTTRTGAKHTSKDNETHALPQKAVSTTSCDSLHRERRREQQKKRARKSESERESQTHVNAAVLGGKPHARCFQLPSQWLLLSRAPVPLQPLLAIFVLTGLCSSKNLSQMCWGKGKTKQTCFFFLVRALTVPRSRVRTHAR